MKKKITITHTPPWIQQTLFPKILHYFILFGSWQQLQLQQCCQPLYTIYTYIHTCIHSVSIYILYFLYLLFPFLKYICVWAYAKQGARCVITSLLYARTRRKGSVTLFHYFITSLLMSTYIIDATLKGINFIRFYILHGAAGLYIIFSRNKRNSLLRHMVTYIILNCIFVSIFYFI